MKSSGHFGALILVLYILLRIVKEEVTKMGCHRQECMKSIFDYVCWHLSVLSGNYSMLKCSYLNNKDISFVNLQSGSHWNMGTQIPLK